EERFDSINQAEKHWARNGAVVLKFFLHVSQHEQRKRFLDRIVDPDDNWKFSSNDMKESEKYDQYMDAYDAMLNATSTPWAPWYCIPADKKPYMRTAVADIVVGTLAQLPLAYPVASNDARTEMENLRRRLEAELARD